VVFCCMEFDALQPHDIMITRIAFFLGVLEYTEGLRELWMQMALKMSEEAKTSFAHMLEELFILQLIDRVPEEHQDYIIARKQEELHEQQEITVQTQVIMQLERLAPKLAS